MEQTTIRKLAKLIIERLDDEAPLFAARRLSNLEFAGDKRAGIWRAIVAEIAAQRSTTLRRGSGHSLFRTPN